LSNNNGNGYSAILPKILASKQGWHCSTSRIQILSSRSFHCQCTSHLSLTSSKDNSPNLRPDPVCVWAWLFVVVCSGRTMSHASVSNRTKLDWTKEIAVQHLILPLLGILLIRVKLCALLLCYCGAISFPEQNMVLFPLTEQPGTHIELLLSTLP